MEQHQSYRLVCQTATETFPGQGTTSNLGPSAHAPSVFIELAADRLSQIQARRTRD
jgi:hypothetical protein